MNLTKLFEAQKVLRDRIAYNEPDRFNKLVLALLVELGECANEWRGFKFWSKSQEPRTFKWFGKCKKCRGAGVDDENYGCQSCAGTGDGHINPLLEEYVDGLHFILELGLEIDTDVEEWFLSTNIKVFTYNGITDQFNNVFWHVKGFVESDKDQDDYEDLVYAYLALGEMLGLTPGQIEQAYLDKNAVNHQRQDENY